MDIEEKDDKKEIKDVKMGESEKPNISKTIKQLIEEFWNSDEISRVSPSDTRVIKRKSKNNVNRVVEPVRIRTFSINESFKKFQIKYPNLCSRSTFFKYKPKNIKTSKRYTDFCPICKSSKKLLEMKPESGIYKDKYDDAIFHQELAKTRSMDLQETINNLKEGSCVLIMDFKENIQLGKAPVETSKNFFKAPQRTCLGISGFFKNGKKTFLVNFSVLSSLLNHSTKIAVDILKEKILTHSIFKSFKISDIHLWLDNGPHFRSKEFLADILLLPNFDIKINFFCPYHGKSFCDQHFGVINRIYSSATKGENGVAVTTTDEFIQVYRNGVTASGNYVFYENSFDFESMVPLGGQDSSGKYNSCMMEYSIPDIQQTHNVGKKSIIYCRRKLEITTTGATMDKFFQFELSSGILKAKLHAKHEKSYTLTYEIKSKDTSFEYKIGSLFEDPKAPSKMLNKPNKARLFHQLKSN